MRYKDGIPDYESLTPEEARDELSRLPTVEKEANNSYCDWGGDYDAHVFAHQQHRDTLTAIAARPQAEPCPSTN